MSDILEEENLIILESTSPVGTTEILRDTIYNKRPDLIDKLYFAYCPERVLPGRIFIELEENDRVIGGINTKSSELAKKFYENFVSGKFI